jgi:predicted enzyme related to lactoylglutathione lyase
LKKLACYGVVLLLTLGGCAQNESMSRPVPLTDTPLYGKFIWHDLITDDVAAAKSFYGELFGWTFEDTKRPGGGDYTLIVSGKGLYVGGMVQLDDPGDGEDYSRWLGYLAVPNVDRASETITAAGGELVVSPRELGMVARVAAVKDPQGAVLGLIKSKVGYPQDNFNEGLGTVSFNELLATDDRQAANFYRDLIGGNVVDEKRGDKTYLMLRTGERNRAGIMQMPADGLEPLWLTHFSVEDAATAAARASSLGGKVLLAPQDDIRGGKVTLLTDPMGAILALNAGR